LHRIEKIENEAEASIKEEKDKRTGILEAITKRNKKLESEERIRVGLIKALQEEKTELLSMHKEDTAASRKEITRLKRRIKESENRRRLDIEGYFIDIINLKKQVRELQLVFADLMSSNVDDVGNLIRLGKFQKHTVGSSEMNKENCHLDEEIKILKEQIASMSTNFAL